MPELSVTDLAVAAGNAQLLGLLYQNLPAELVLDFFDRANTVELAGPLAPWVAQVTGLFEESIRRVPELSARSEQISREFGEFMVRCNATLYTLADQWQRDGTGPLAVAWHGEALRRARVDRRGLVVVAPQLGYNYAVPAALAAAGLRVTVLGNVPTHELLDPLVSTLAPRLAERLCYLRVPEPATARRAAAALAEGRTLVLFPEVNMGGTGNLRAETMPFLGRTIWVPTTSVRFARIAGVDVVGMTVTPAGDRSVAVAVSEPWPHPSDRSGDGAAALAVFGWLERAVLRWPHLWWCWRLLDTQMAVRAPDPKGR